jgi:hypothetical protein
LSKAIASYIKMQPKTFIVGKVKKENTASNMVFVKLGFKTQKTTANSGYHKFTLLPAADVKVSNS